MTKRKRTPSSSPPPPAPGPFQIPASLRRLSIISRSLAHQSDKLAGLDQDHQDEGMIAQPQDLGDATLAVPAASAGTDAGKRRGKGFRAFAPPKQPSFPDAQTWVEPRPRGSRAPDHAGFMPPTQPSFPQGQSWPQPQPRKVINWPQLQPPITAASKSGPDLVPPPVPLDAALANLEAAPAEGETLCLETQPDRIAALIAQKRAANEANRRREAWTRRAAAHRVSSQAPDDQLLSELNSVLEQSPTADSSTQKHTSAPNDAGRPDTGGHQNPSDSEQYVHPTAAITFDPVVPSTRTQADTSSTAKRKKGLMGGKKRNGGQTSALFAKLTKGISSHDHDSLFSSSGSLSPSPAGHPKRGGGRGEHPEEQQHNQHDSSEAQLSAAASAAPPVNSTVTQMPSNSTRSKSKLESNTRNPKTSSVPQPSQRDQPAPVAAGYYRFNPRHWQSSSTSQQQQQQQQQQQSQASAPDAQSGYQGIEANVWPASRNTPQKLQSNVVFRNLTQDKFGRFGVGGKLKETADQESGANS